MGENWSSQKVVQGRRICRNTLSGFITRRKVVCCSVVMCSQYNSEKRNVSVSVVRMYLAIDEFATFFHEISSRNHAGAETMPTI
jgi:hypothetical protein